MIGKQLRNYRIESVIGDGGMSTVYRGTDVRLGRPIAVKVLHSHLTREVQVRERFEDEARIQARLNHPNIVAVIDFFAEGDALCMVLEYVDGRSLETVIEQETGPMIYGQCLTIMTQVLSAVGHAHAYGVIHRDLKPSNILVCGRGMATVAKVADFGIAKILDSQKQRTATGTKMGTVWYMAPEQVRAQQVDARTDIYALGVTLYQMVSGKVPFDSDSEFDLMAAILEKEPPPPTTIYAGIPPRLEQVVLKAMMKDPAQRFRSAEEFLEGLESVRDGGGQRFEPRAVGVARKEITIGRGLDCEYQIEHAFVSSRHARFSLMDGLYVIEDLGSANGTYVNGELIAPFRPTPVQIGSRVTAGSTIPISVERAVAILGCYSGKGPPAARTVMEPQAPTTMEVLRPAAASANPTGGASDESSGWEPRESFSGAAAMTLLFYFLGFWIVGLIMNLVYLSKANEVTERTGEDPPGKGSLVLLFFLLGVVTPIIVIMILASDH
jgi:pSer/pThr/pTyr-binding forkhead associated (FHA) protein